MPGVDLEAPVRPPDRPVSRLLEPLRVLVGGVHHVIQLHHDVSPDSALRLVKLYHVT